MATKVANQIQVGTQLINSDNQLFTITIINGNLIWATTISNGSEHITLIQLDRIGELNYGAWYEIVQDSIKMRWDYQVLLFRLNYNFSQSDLIQMAKENEAEISFFKNAWDEDRAKIWNESGCLIFKKEGINNYKLGNS